jgi:hypothetical protein
MLDNCLIKCVLRQDCFFLLYGHMFIWSRVKFHTSFLTGKYTSINIKLGILLWLNWPTKSNFFVPRTSIDIFSCTFYGEFRYVYRMFLSGRVSKTQKNLNVQNSTFTCSWNRQKLFFKMLKCMNFAGIWPQIPSSNSLPTYLRSTCFGTAFQ